MEDYIHKAECKACQELYTEINNSQNRRLDALEADVKQIHSLTISVEKMAVSLEQMARELAKQGERLDEIEAEPARKWKQAGWIAISVVLTAVVTYFLSHIGMG